MTKYLHTDISVKQRPLEVTGHVDDDSEWRFAGTTGAQRLLRIFNVHNFVCSV